MKSKLLVLLYVLMTQSSISQTLDHLKLETLNYFEAHFLMDFETIVNASYPKMVETFTKEKMLVTVENRFENEEHRLRFQLQTIPLTYSKITTLAGQSFCIISGRNPLRYFFETKLNTQTAAEKAEWLKQVNRSQEVTFEPKRNSFNVRRTTTFIAVADASTAQKWKFFNLDDPLQYQAFKTLFDETILKALGL